VKHGLDNVSLVDCFSWTEEDFKQKMAGSAIYRIGYEQWLRNIAIGLGNAKTTPEVIHALQRPQTNELLQEHVAWALSQHKKPNT